MLNLFRAAGLVSVLALSGCVGAGGEVPATASELLQEDRAVVVSRGFAVENTFMGRSVAKAALRYRREGGSRRETFGLLTLPARTGVASDEYKIQSVPAGSYIISLVRRGDASSRLGNDVTSRITLEPGDVVYMGDVEIDATEIGGRSLVAITVRNQVDAARAALAAQSPELAAQLETRLVRCRACRGS